MSGNRDGVPIWPFAIVGFIVGWIAVSAFRRPLVTLAVVVALFATYHIMLGVDAAQDAIHEPQAGSSVTVELPPAREQNIVSSTCPDTAPNVGEPFLC